MGLHLLLQRRRQQQTGPLELRPVGETEFLEEIARENVRANHVTTAVAGIVAYADLALSDAVTGVLEAHLKASPDRLRGIRYSTMWDSSDSFRSVPCAGLLQDAAVRRGLECLQPLGLSFDAWVYHPQLPELVELARNFPGTLIILNHIGGGNRVGIYANRDDEVMDAWRKGIATVAECPNVVVKLGGMGMPRWGFDWHARAIPIGSEELAGDMSPWKTYCIEKFGPDRCMLESNFPPDKVSFSYNVMYNAFKRLSQNYTATERAAIFHDTAAKVYRLS